MDGVKIKLGIFLLVGLLLISLISADYGRTNFGAPHFEGTGMGGGLKFDKSMCEAGQDFVIQIAPFGCTPAVVRTDLLEEQNVPVFCQLGATKINPLIDVEAIESISFTGEYPEEVSGIGFHPARAALGVEENLNFPVLNNIGYVVILLKKQENASAMPEFVQGNLTAKIKYDIKNAFGIGKAGFYLPELTDEQWEDKYIQYGFWDGRGYLRAEDIETDRAIISIYTDIKKISSVSLKEGETSKKIYMPGFECMAGLEIKLESLEDPDTRAKLIVNGDVVEVAEGEKFLENKCYIKKEGIRKEGLVQKVTIKCGDEKAFNLKIEPQVNLSIDGVEEGYEVGDWLYKTADENKSVYLGYVGTMEDTGKKEDLYVYLVAISEHKDKLTEDEISTGVERFDDINSGTIKIGEWTITKEDIKLLSCSEEKDIFNKDVKIVGFAGAQDEDLGGEEYYENAMEDYETIMDSFSGEKYSDKITYGEETLYQKIFLAGDTEQKRAVVELCEEFRERYPNSGKNLRKYCDNEYKLSSSEIASRSVMINGGMRKISFDGIYEPSLDDYSVEIKVKDSDGKITFPTLRKNQIIYLDDEVKKEFIQLISIEDDSAKVKINFAKEDGKLVSDTKTLEKNIMESFETDYTFTLTKVNLKKSARVSVIPNIDNVGTEASFGFKIGIEKRAIKLSPEKTKEIIDGLNETIAQWTEISEGLGKVVKGFKTACLGVGAWLTVKNFFANTGGKSIARQEVMRGEGGWYERCADLVAGGEEYDSIEECMYREGDEIDKDVDEYYNALKKQNEEIKELQKDHETSKFLTETYVNTEEFGRAYLSSDYQSELKTNLREKFGDTIEIQGEQVNIDDFVDNLNPNTSSIGQLRNLQLNSRLSGTLEGMAKDRLKGDISDIYINTKDEVKRQTLASELAEKGLKNVRVRPFADEGTKIEVYDGATVGDGRFGGMEEGTPIQVITYQNKEYVLKLKPLENNQYQIDEVYETNGSISEKEEEMKNLYAYFKKFDETSYNNPYTSSLSDPNKPVLRYYETEPYKGLPAIVPFDLDNGWYASISQTLPILGNIRAYSDSGRVESLYVCNVWENGREENKGGDDKCTMINLGTRQAYDEISGLTDLQARKIVGCAIDAVEQASRASRSGVKRVQISTSCDTFYVDVGKPAVDIPDMQCQDFMSPKDCQLLFNVCDPVVCPSSRCDFGGAYPVKDVIQSGIIGSIALCLPNIKEGIYIPVCLTGVKAGIDGLLSVYTSYRDCLQNSLDTGEMVGVCDEIYSIYMCEFLWRQALPLAKIAIPKMMELMLGQNVRGGGEYLGIASAWDNADKSVNYFTQYYAANSYKAFKARTTEEVGGEFCKMYVSGVYPEGGNLLDSLTEPDSPFQSHGWFDEIPFSSVTVPPISHYKVFYHIFAGKDSGVYYRVYLKGVPESSYYQDVSATRIVDSGYIAAGGYASETKDFTAPSGYKEMCIMVNNQEECGFKQVSTSFAVNYVKDEYIASQARETDIKTEKECIAGSASAYSLLTPSPQGAAEEIVNPAIYNRGIIRICATDNPGKGTDAYAGEEDSRWVEVGYCDNKNMKCWLDTKSVKDVIRTTTTEEDVLEEVSKNQLEILRNEEGYLSEDDSKKVIDDVEELIEDSKFEEAIDKVDDNFDKVFLNSEKARLLFLRGNAYGKLALSAVDVEKGKDTAVTERKVGDEEERDISKLDYNIDAIINGEENLPTFWESEEEDAFCARYSRIGAEKFFELNYHWCSVWCREFVEEVIWKADSRLEANNNYLERLEEEGRLKPGMIIGVYYPKSQYNGKKTNCWSDEEIIIRYTHNLLYLGKNDAGKLVFAEYIYREPGIRTLNKFEDDGLIAMAVFGAPGELNPEKSVQACTEPDFP